MSREFPDWINPWTAAQGRRRFAGTVPLVRMKRLAHLVESTDGAAAFEASLSLDEDKRPVIDLQVAAELVLMCQASLRPYVAPVSRRSTLGVIESEAEVDLLPDNYDPVQADNGRLAIAGLVEDELILALPQVPRNPAIDVVNYSTGDDEGVKEAERPSPFAGLRDKLGGQ